jgi:hypothetical protein
MKRLALLVILSGCAVPAARPPDDLRDCPANAAVPRSLPRIRTTAQIAAFADHVELAREADAAARDACADKLRRLFNWTTDGRSH